jgi:mRNA interferase RelE/StbE
VSSGPYQLGLTRPARRAISELPAQDAAAAAVEFITGPLLEAPYRVGKPLRDTLSGFRSAWLGTQGRVLYRIDESKRAVIVQGIQHPVLGRATRLRARGLACQLLSASGGQMSTR